MNGVPPQKIRNVYGVAKIYETYVGNKSFEPQDPIFADIRALGGEYGATTGRPRQCNWLDLDNLQKACRVNGVTHLVMNKMDILRDLRVWELYHGDKTQAFPTEFDMKEYICDNFFNDVGGVFWSDNPNDIGTFKAFEI